MGRALKFLPNYSLVCGWLYFQPAETILSPSHFWLDGWHFCLYLWWISWIILYRWPPHIFFLKGNLLQISSGLEVILGNIWFTNLGLLEFSKVDFTKFGVLGCFVESSEYYFFVYWLGVAVPFSVWILFSRESCAFFYSRVPRDVSFLDLFCLFWFVHTWLLLRGRWCHMLVFFWFK